jgi:hypothetical protein
MGTLVDLTSQIPLSRLPSGATLDSELANALEAHLANADPHGQYLLERVLPLLFYGVLGVSSSTAFELQGMPGVSTQPFDANSWTPNSNQAHKSPIAFARVSGVNLPNPLAFFLIQIEVLLGSKFEGENLIQVAIQSYSQIYIRQKNMGTWEPWNRLAFQREQNDFASLNTFSDGVRIGQPVAGSAPTIIRKLLSSTFTIDPPLLASGQPQLPAIPLTIQGAAIGDFVQVAPIGTDIIYTGIWPFEFRAVVTAANTISLYPLNDWTGGNLDLAPFQVRVIVLGF